MAIPFILLSPSLFFIPLARCESHLQIGLSLLCSKIFQLFFLALLFFSPIIPKIMLTIFMIPAHNLHTMYRFHCL